MDKDIPEMSLVLEWKVLQDSDPDYSRSVDIDVIIIKKMSVDFLHLVLLIITTCTCISKISLSKP